MKKILIALFSLVLVVSFVLTKAQVAMGYPPLVVSVCNHTATVRNASSYQVPLTVLNPFTGYTFNQPIFGGQIISFPIAPAEYLLISSQGSLLFLETDYVEGCFVAFDGALFAGYQPQYPQYPYNPPVVYYQTYSPEVCALGTYQGVLPLLPGVNAYSGGNVSVFQVDSPESDLLRQQITLDAVLNGGKFDALTRCVDRVAVTSWVGPNNVYYNVSGWYKAYYANGSPIATFALLAGRTNQVIVRWYDSSHFGLDNLRHYLLVN